MCFRAMAGKVFAIGAFMFLWRPLLVS